MLPGPDQVIACPHCGYPALQPTLASGNTYHAQLWSDGKLDAPMLPEYPAITRCRGCRTVFWIRDAPVIGEIGPWRDDIDSAPADWQAADRVDWPGLDEYADALDSPLETDREDERYLRIHYWWICNDPLREQQLDELETPQRKCRKKRRLPQRHVTGMRGNLDKLARLLDARKPPERLMKADVARQLGKFGTAIALLEKCPQRYRDYAEQMLVFASAGDHQVRPLVDTTA